MIVAAYLRVSTREQDDNGHGLDAQRHAIQTEALRRGWTDVTWVAETASGRDLKRRPKLEAALALLEGEDLLVVSKLDRLSRSLLDFCGLVERAEREGWTLVCLDPALDLSTPGGKMTAHVLGAFAQYERELIGQRTREGLAAARAKGIRLGAPPRIKPDVINRILRERAAGRSYNGIARSLNDDGVPTATRTGKRWYASTVRAVVLR